MMRSSRSRRIVIPLVIGALLVGVAVWRWSPSPISQANFARIHPGMSMTDVEATLGEPRFTSRDFGLVEPDGTYVTNLSATKAELQKRGFQDYNRVQWSSSEMSIIVVADLDGTVATTYTGSGQSRDWIRALFGWVQKLF